MWVFFSVPWCMSQYQARGIFYQPPCVYVDLSETRAGHKLALKYITHNLMGGGCSQALKYNPDTGPVNGWPLWHISFWRISPV